MASLDDYDFERPKADLKAKSQIKRNHALSDFEVYDYPGGYTKAKDGNHYAKVRVEEMAAQHERVHMEGTARGLTTGSLFELEGFQ